MITESNFRNVLIKLGFKENKELNEYEKKVKRVNAVMRVSFSSKKLYFPIQMKGVERNDGFEHPENFVVFECVNRLLEKGYRPENIELEKEWHLGHDAKSGRADICVSDQDNSTLFIIECKTWGKEFEKAFNDTKHDGAQLFSYWQQEQACKWMVLYTSDFQKNAIVYKCPTIDCSDDSNIIFLAKKDQSIKLYINATTTSEKYEVWSETYNCEIHDNLIFSDDSVAYQIGVKPLLKKDLRDFAPDDKIVNRFEEILRHNNVSDKENAFNRLIALFICKLVDESTKGEDDEVEFQYKQGTDTYEDLQDRLQRLHRDGMEKFMHEKIYYVSADYPEKLFLNYTGQKRKQAIEDLNNTIRILKFYSNNDFAFKDVHNEELFYQNGKILVEMVQLFEQYRIVYSSKHQFLGDLFEQLLNKGFKQNEGQYFTPMPITRFIWDSLPVSRTLKSDRGTIYPKIIDYACGAGHFLTEAVEAINFYANNNGDNSWVKDCIYGVEKDYRLARVSKISLFMNGAGDGNIIFGDGLENYSDKGIQNETFDILVSNPPYSVKDFKQHLQIKNNSFSLIDCIGLNGGEIETLFIERIAQLLKPRGIAAVILPSSILSNDSASYTGSRELILQNFYIRAIVSLGSKTFSATGTNTVILFLEKFSEPPKLISLYADSVEAIFSDRDISDWQDRVILEAYLNLNNIDNDIYRAFLNKEYSIADFEADEYFKMYVDAFSTSSEARILIKSKIYNQNSNEEKNALYLSKFYSYVFNIEKEKLFYFSLIYRQKTIVITAPSDNKAQKEFLGYDWSNRKGNEGIQIIHSGGKMYDDSDRAATGTLADAIRKSFYELVPSFSLEQQSFASVSNTKELLDFSRPTFNKSIRTSFYKKTVKIESVYPMKKIGEIKTLLMRGHTPVYGDSNIQIIKSGQARGYSNFDFSERYFQNNNNTDERKLQKGDILINCTGKGTAGRVTWFDLEGDFVCDSHIAILRCNNQVIDKYVFYVLAIQIGFSKLENMADGASGQIELSLETIQNITIPIPPINVQILIVDKITALEHEYNHVSDEIDQYNSEIQSLYNDLDKISSNGEKFSLADHKKFSVFIGKRVLDRQLIPNGIIPVYSANVIEPFGFINVVLFTDFSVASVLWGIDGDWMTNYIPKDTKFYPTDHCGVLRCLTSEVNPKYLSHILMIEGQKIGFSRSYRASLERIQGITFTLPEREIQDEYMLKINSIEKQINKNKDQLIYLNKKISDTLHDSLIQKNNFKL